MVPRSFMFHCSMPEAGGIVFTLSSLERGEKEEMGTGGHTQENIKTRKIRLELVKFHSQEELRSDMSN